MKPDIEALEKWLSLNYNEALNQGVGSAFRELRIARRFIEAFNSPEFSGKNDEEIAQARRDYEDFCNDEDLEAT